MTLLEELGNFIQSKNIGSVGIDIFFNTQPAEPPDCITIIDTGGYPTDESGVIRNPTFQFLIRNEKYSEAKVKSDLIFDELNQEGNYTLGDYYIYYSEFEDEPTYIGEDDNGRAEISINLKIERRN